MPSRARLFPWPIAGANSRLSIVIMPVQYAHHACGAAKVPFAVARPLRPAGMARHSPTLPAARKRRSAKRDTSEIEHTPMTRAGLTITSKNYSSWSLRGWLLARFAGIEFEEKIVPADDPAVRAELLLLSPSIMVPCLTHDGTAVWDTLAI